MRPFNLTRILKRGDVDKGMTIKRPFNPTQTDKGMSLARPFNPIQTDKGMSLAKPFNPTQIDKGMSLARPFNPTQVSNKGDIGIGMTLEKPFNLARASTRGVKATTTMGWLRRKRHFQKRNRICHQGVTYKLQMQKFPITYKTTLDNET
jgi:hypothetical protein